MIYFLAAIATHVLFSPSLVLGADYLLPPVSSTETQGLLETASPARAVSDLYNFALGLGAIAAFGLIVYSALQYTTTDSPGKRQEAQGRIYQSLLGLLLLLGATVVLRFINPDLPQLQNPGVQPLPSAQVERDTTPSDGLSGTAGPGCEPIADGQVGSPQYIEEKLAGTPYAGCFGDKLAKASGVIRVESNGIADRESTSDKCNPPPARTVSIGLFQINISAHHLGSLQCAGTAIQGQFQGSPANCRIINEAQYGLCVTKAKDPRENIIEACKTFKLRSNSFALWGPATKQKCGI